MKGHPTQKPPTKAKREVKNRQEDHLQWAAQAQMTGKLPQQGIDYEPLLAAHPAQAPEVSFLGKTCTPLWIAPLSLGPAGRKINQRLAKVAAQYRLGWMLGSMRQMLEQLRIAGAAQIQAKGRDYLWRDRVGDIPLWANLGIAQLEQLVAQQDYALLDEALQIMQVDGLVIHVNPWQEWWQPEGDRLTQIPLHTIEKFLAHTTWPIIIREVGQGFGPRSLAALLDLPLAALDLAGWGGTNFTSLEARRAGRADFGLAQVGHTCEMMVQQICARPLGQVKNFILSGGQANLAAAFVLHQQLATIGASSVVALAYPLLAAAQHSADRLQNVVQDWLHAWAAAQNYLRWRPHA